VERIAWSQEAEICAGGSGANGRANLVGQVDAEGLDVTCPRQNLRP